MGTHGNGIEITTSYRATPSFSSSYSMLTSQVPSLDGVGQQLTKPPGAREVQVSAFAAQHDTTRQGTTMLRSRERRRDAESNRLT